MQEKRSESGKRGGVAVEKGREKKEKVPHKLQGGEGFYVVLLCSLTQKRLKF